MTSKRAYGNSIIVKVVVCLFLPIMAQCFLFWQFYQVEKRSLVIAQQEAQMIDFGSKSHDVLFTLVSGVTAYCNFIATGSTYQRQLGKEYMADVQKGLATLRELAKDNPMLNDQMRTMMETAQPALDAVNASVANANDRDEGHMESMLQQFLRLRPIMKNAGDLNKKALASLKVTQAKVERIRKENEDAHAQQTHQIFGGLVLVTLVGLLAAGWLGFDLARRLGLLVDNAFRMPRGIPMAHEVTGNDELSYLDEVLHEADGYLKDAAAQRNLIMEMVAHDMRSPLMSAQIALDLLTQMSPPSTDGAIKQAITLRRNLGTVINLVNDLLTIDRLESGQLELHKAPRAISQLVDDAIISTESSALTKEIKLVNATSPESYIFADGDRVIQVLVNLISNAIKFSPRGGTITISSADQERFVQTCVQDEGPGLPAGTEKSIFDKFQQLEGSQKTKGFGLGLTICKMLVDLHGGTIRATRLADKGSKFCFWLPVCPKSERERYDAR